VTEKMTVDPLIMAALQLVWKQQEELQQQQRAIEVAEKLSEKRFSWRWEVKDVNSGVVLKKFPTRESMEPFLERIQYQHGKLKITKKLCCCEKSGNR